MEGSQPPKRLPESSCGDFHSLPQVLLKPLAVKDSVSCQFLPARSPACLISEKFRAASGLWWAPPGRALVIASHPGPRIGIPEEVVVEVVTIQLKTIANS